MSHFDFPEWPNGEDGTVLMDIVIDKTVNDAFILFHGGETEYRKKVEEANKHADFQFSGWKEKEDEVVDSPGVKDVLPSLSALKPEMMCVKQFGSPGGMGKVYVTHEYMKVKEVDEKKLLMFSVVRTKAPYGDKFGVLMKHDFVAVEKDSCRISITSTIVYFGSINGMIKGMIEKGSREGMKKSQENALSVLKNFAAVKPFGEEHIERSKPVAPRKETALEFVFGRSLIQAMDPWASLVQVLLGQWPFMPRLKSSQLLWIFLTICLLNTSRVIITILQGLKSISDQPGDSVTFVLHHFFKVFYVPNGIHELLSGFLILVLAHGILSQVGKLLPRPSQGTSDDVRAENEYGVKYDGYGSAVSGAAYNQYVGIDQKSEFALEQIAKGIEFMAKGFKRRKKKSKTPKETTPSDEPTDSSNSGHKKKKVGKLKTVGGALLDKSTDKQARREKEEEAANTTEVGDGDNENSSASMSVALDPIGYSPPDLPHSVRTKAVVEEIFENERHQPFRGWGSTWPGHFLPTDKVHRWSVRNVGDSGIYSSQVMSKIVPHPPDGWKWLEPAWNLDLSGTMSDSTDNEGWSYGLDFKKTSYPFQPGTGRKKMSDFVRRRRWLRTRIPIDSAENMEEHAKSNLCQSDDSTKSHEGILDAINNRIMANVKNETSKSSDPSQEKSQEESISKAENQGDSHIQEAETPTENTANADVIAETTNS